MKHTVEARTDRYLRRATGHDGWDVKRVFVPPTRIVRTGR